MGGLGPHPCVWLRHWMSPTMNLINMTHHLYEKKKIHIYNILRVHNHFLYISIYIYIYIYQITKAVTSGRQETHPEIVVQNGHKVKQSQKV